MAESRERLRTAAIRQQPWQRRAGKAPATADGKKQQRGQPSVREVRAELAEVRSWLRGLREARREVGRLRIDALVGGHVLGEESVRRHIQQLKADLLGPHPTRVEQILVEDIAVCYLAARHSELAAAQPGNQSLGQAALRIRRCHSAQRRLQRALKNLVLLRAKAPEGLAPLNDLRLHAAEEELRQQA
jgi:hypothetical protein